MNGLKKLNRVLKGGPGSGHHGHAGRPGKRGGGAPSGGSGNMVDFSKGGAFQHRKQLLDNLESLKGKFVRDSYTDPEGVTYRVTSKVNNWTTGKNVAGTTEQQRYNVELNLYASDSKGNKGWSETIAKSSTFRQDSDFDTNRSKAIANIKSKASKLLGVNL